MARNSTLEVVTCITDIELLAMSTFDLVDNARHSTLFTVYTFLVPHIWSNTITWSWLDFFGRNSLIELGIKIPSVQVSHIGKSAVCH